MRDQGAGSTVRAMKRGWVADSRAGGGAGGGGVATGGGLAVVLLEVLGRMTPEMACTTDCAGRREEEREAQERLG